MPTLLTKRKAICGFIVMVRFHAAPRGCKSAMSYNGIASTGESLWIPHEVCSERYAQQLKKKGKGCTGSRMAG